MKTCTRCKETKLLDLFQNRKKSSDGKDSACASCRRAYDKTRYSTDENRRNTIREHEKASRVKNVNWIWNYLLANPCVDCGESDAIVLEFDHRADKVGNVSNMVRHASLSTIIKEVAKCDVRCANCHRKKTAKQFDWYKDIVASDVAT